MKKNNKKNIVVSALLCVALLGSTLAISYAWFINNRIVGVHTDENMTITVGSRLEIGVSGEVVGETNWGSSVTMSTGDKTCPDISGDGVNFYFPTTLTVSDEPTYDIPKNFKHINVAENPGDYYIYIKLKFRTSTPMEVYLSRESDITGENLDRHDDLSLTVPSGSVAGAFRVGFSEEISTVSEDGESIVHEELKSIWIPNDKYELQPNESGEGLVFNENGNRESEYYYLKPNNGEFNSATESMVLESWTLDDYASGKILVGKDRLASNESDVLHSNGSTPLLSFQCEDGEIEEKSLIVRVWVEGTDREAHTNLNGGQIHYNLDFLGISKDDPSAEKKAVYEELQADSSGLYTTDENGSRIAYDNSVSVDYSFNGIDWQVYDETADLEALFGAQQNVCIRMSETDDERTKEYRLLSFDGS